MSGPSGAGKSTICKALRKKDPKLHFSVSCTTRAPRKGEKDGIEYYFISQADFKKKIQSGAFLEHAKVHSNYYGTLKSEVISRIRSGIDVLLDIDVQGAMQIKKNADRDKLLSKCIETVFIAPPSFEELEKRLRSRATDSESVIRERLSHAKKELDFWKEYDYLMVNRKLDDTIADMLNLKDAIHKKTCRFKDSGFYG
ncbi:MAG TPA: guanylate kinase [Victivallales bacterium]|nr:guanylate kinase [Victivallales bacterium]